MFRRRVCDECGKPLGGTLGTCYEHGGEKAAQSWWRERKQNSERVESGIHGIDK